MIILYNSLAFGLQSLFGFLADKLKSTTNFAIYGCLLLIAGIFSIKNFTLSVILIGIGNAMFHVGGGIIALEAGNGRAKLPGIFVSFGAIGLFLGTLIGAKNFNIIWIAFLPLICIAALLFITPQKETQKIYQNNANKPLFIFIIILILLSVCIRSFIGLSYEFLYKNNFSLLLCYIMAIALGKSLGGFFADKFGMYNTAVIGLLLSIPLLKYTFVPIFPILGMFCFNLTMPVTLTALANMMPNFKGFAFGLTTLALLIGFLPSLYELKVSQSFLLFEIIFVSVIITAISLSLYEKTFKKP
jgi:FSR family fosmidomycin resistance protein-like MFS transporter